jgi:preprotein translocase subunit YajC
MGNLLEKLDEIMKGDQVRKLGGLFCLVTVIISVAAFIIGAGSLLKSMKGPAVEVTEEAAEEGAEEGAAEEATEEEATDEGLEEEAEEEAEE